MVDSPYNPVARSPRADADDFASLIGEVRSLLGSGCASERGGDYLFPPPVGGVGNLDRDMSCDPTLTHGERELVKRVEGAVGEGSYCLPHLQESHAALVELLADRNCDFAEVEGLVSSDVALTAILLRLANQTRDPSTDSIGSIREAADAVGMHGLRSLVLTLSLKDVIFRPPWLADCAMELWRQAISIAFTARELAVPLCLDPERTFVLGILHDVGKIPLLRIIREVSPTRLVRPSVLGALLHRFHEDLGEQLCLAWRLPEEIAAVAGCHHEFQANHGFPLSAALVFLAHQLDLALSTGDREGYFALAKSSAMQKLELPDGFPMALLVACRDSYVANRVGRDRFGRGMGSWQRGGVPYHLGHEHPTTPLD